MSIIINSKTYIIIRELGGDKNININIYQVLNREENKYYVIKKISLKNEDPETIIKIKKEAEFLSKFNSDNIVKYHGSLFEKDNFYILMEYCDGNDLQNFIEKFVNKRIYYI